MTAVPGGISFVPNQLMIDTIRTKYEPVKLWIEKTAVYDLLNMFEAAKGMGAGEWGIGPGNFLCAGVYDLADGTQYFNRGVYVGSTKKRIDMDPAKITEDITSARYTSESGGYPGVTVTEYDLAKSAYTWYKAPRYGEMVVEVGPLARLVVNNIDPLNLRRTYVKNPDKSSTLSRLIARGQEILLLKDKVSEWLDELEKKLPSLDKVYEAYSIPKNASGIGLWEAPRGATLHWVSTNADGKISQYQVIAGTTWNGSGRDINGNPGPFEQSLIGVPAQSNPKLGDKPDPINMLRTIRSFDPCIACSVQLLTPEGEKYSIQAV
jgi:hydrogenase large subunit